MGLQAARPVAVRPHPRVLRRQRRELCLQRHERPVLPVEDQHVGAPGPGFVADLQLRSESRRPGGSGQLQFQQVMLGRLVRKVAVAWAYLVIEVPGAAKGLAGEHPAATLRTRQLQPIHSVDVRPGAATTEVFHLRTKPAPARMHGGLPYQPPPV